MTVKSKLANKVAIVTGGSAGIGEAISKKFALEGAKVVVSGRPEDPVDQVVAEITSAGGTAIGFKGDISLAANAQACVELAIATWDHLDILINNAGVFPAVGVVEEYPLEAFEYLLKNNIQSTFLMTKFALPYLQKTKGNIVSAGSEAGLDGDAENAAYSGTKGFVHAFTKAVAAEQAPYGVRANIVAPGPIDTAWTHKQTGPMTTKMEKMLLSATPMGRRGTPEEVANVYLFLASQDASYVTGAIYSVDGGITIGKGPIGLQADSTLKKEPEGELDLKHSKEGDPVVRPFKSTRDGKGYSDERNSTLKTVSTVVAGLGLVYAAANAVMKLSSKSKSAENKPVNQSVLESNIAKDVSDDPAANAVADFVDNLGSATRGDIVTDSVGDLIHDLGSSEVHPNPSGLYTGLNEDPNDVNAMDTDLSNQVNDAPSSRWVDPTGGPILDEPVPKTSKKRTPKSKSSTPNPTDTKPDTPENPS